MKKGFGWLKTTVSARSQPVCRKSTAPFGHGSVSARDLRERIR